MPKKANRLSTVSTALFPSEALQLKQLAQAKGLSISELCREGMQWYLANHDKAEADSRETLLEKRMKKMEDRLASLLARIAIDIGTVFCLAYRSVDEKDRDDLLSWAYNVSVSRLKKRLEGQAAEVKEAMQVLDDDKDSDKAQLRKRQAR